MDYEMDLDYLDELFFEQPEEDSDEDLLPAYLREPPIPSRTFGTLSYNRRSKCWTVKGDPSVTEMCKRLFPGSAGSKRGEARFTAHRRMVGELCWLMLRFPLTVKMSDLPLWDKAVADARENAKRNGIENAEFFCGDAGAAALELEKQGVKADVVVVDPPRKGLNADAIEAIAKMSPRRIVYVSCDPATLARDVALLKERGCTLQNAMAADLFPRCAHVESIVCLARD